MERRDAPVESRDDIRPAVDVGIVWPLWLNAVGVTVLPVPNFGAVGPLAGHLVWGMLMGGLFAVMQTRG